MTTTQVLLGEHDYNTAEETDMQRMNVKEILNHPDFNRQTANNDFGLLKLKTAVDFCGHPHIRPICLPTDTSQKFAGVEAILTGWGDTTEGGNVSSTLLEVRVKVRGRREKISFSNDLSQVLSNFDCAFNYGYQSYQITTRMLCDDNGGGGKASCQVRDEANRLVGCYRRTVF